MTISSASTNEIGMPSLLCIKHDKITQYISDSEFLWNCVNSILPGPTETEGNPVLGTAMESLIIANTPLGRVGKPTDVSKLAVFLASDSASWITGQKIAVSGGFD